MTPRSTNSDNEELNRLLSHVADGDQEAYTQLYDAITPLAFGIVRRVVRDPAQSEEVTQEVMLEVWRAAARFDQERGNATAWVATMAHRRAVDRVRSSQSSRDREQVAGRREVAYDAVAEQVVETAEREHVTQAMAALTPLQREAIELAYYGGRTYREVANHLDAPLGTVKTRMRDGLKRLRAALTGPDGGPPTPGMRS
jgi:RNA polymerase sigma-70 factor (ECF subfamily)